MQEIYEQLCGFKWGWKESLTIDGAELLSYGKSERKILRIQRTEVIDKKAVEESWHDIQTN